jgi:ribosomal protein S18 acetylase RimI-like enzyme
VERHRHGGLNSWLHVGAPNRRAIDLYTSLGFKRIRTLPLNRIVRVG